VIPQLLWESSGDFGNNFLMTYHTLDSLPLLQSRQEGLRVLLRVDLNVPVRDGKVTDSTRIERLVPTIKELTNMGCKVVLLSHFGRPNGVFREEMSLEPLVSAISNKLNSELTFSKDCIGRDTLNAVNSLAPGDIILLENLRFHPGEESNDQDFVRAIADLGDLFVNDAFSAAHRAHASTAGLARCLPSAAGRLMQAELEALDAALGNPLRPVAAIVGGAKVSTKLDLLTNLVKKVDRLAIGGAMANTFLYALGTDIGASLCEKELADTARLVLAAADEAGSEIILPSDVVIASEFKEGAQCQTVKIAAVPEDMMILDIGEASATVLSESLKECRTLLWNGPMGAFEISPFDKGTNMVARAAAKLSQSNDLLTIAGGGDTVAALSAAGAVSDFSYVSTAGGAFLEWLEGRELPGVVALNC
jgi:phosphoglycerate kinase